MALSSSLSGVIPLLQLIEETRNEEIIKIPREAKIYCEYFENYSILHQLTVTAKITIIYHQFRESIQKGIIKINVIDTLNQVVYILKKMLNQILFIKHEKQTMSQ